MFDPTAFDNMKVVIEGAFYDLDLSGHIIIIDRNDLMNMAKMSRSFDISFKVSDSDENVITAKMEIEANLKNLAAELLPSSLSESQSGCNLRLQFFHSGVTYKADLDEIERILGDIWGETREISQSVVMHPSVNKIYNVITIAFDRLISEEQMDDLTSMIDFMITTIHQLQSFLNSSK